MKLLKSFVFALIAGNRTQERKEPLKRSKHQVASALDSIPGIGPKTKELLLRKFKSVKRIREASEEELAALVGASKAKILKENLSE